MVTSARLTRSDPRMRGALVDSLEQLRPRNGYTRPLAPRRDLPPPRVVFTPRL